VDQQGRKRAIVVATVLLTGLPVVVRAASIPAQRVAARLTVDVLPEPLRGFYAQRIDAVIERAVEPGGAWRRDARKRGRDDWHYAMLDVAAEDTSRAARLRAVRDFPVRRSDARKLYATHNVKPGGLLPWRLEWSVERLERALETGDEDEVLRATGMVMHFAADASDPFATARDARGRSLGNLIIGEYEFGHADFAHQDAPRRIGWELIRRNAERYRATLDPEQIRFELTIDDIPHEVLAWMVTSYEALDELLAADRDLTGRMGLTDGPKLRARADEFYQLLDAKCGAICVAQLRRSAGLSASLIVTAWNNSGALDTVGDSVELDETTLDPPDDATTPKPPKPLTGGASTEPEETKVEAPQSYVASRNSKVYHSADCSHVKHIHAKNLIQYKSLEDAQKSGKRPCRSCRPGEAE